MMSLKILPAYVTPINEDDYLRVNEILRKLSVIEFSAEEEDDVREAINLLAKPKLKQYDKKFLNDAYEFHESFCKLDEISNTLENKELRAKLKEYLSYFGDLRHIPVLFSEIETHTFFKLTHEEHLKWLIAPYYTEMNKLVKLFRRILRY